MTVEYMGSGNDDGQICFRGSGKGGFFGMTTVITRPAVTAPATATATTTINEAYLSRVVAKLVALGLMTTDG